MELHVIPNSPDDRKLEATRLTCATCQLKKCVGRCRWERVPVRRAA